MQSCLCCTGTNMADYVNQTGSNKKKENNTTKRQYYEKNGSTNGSNVSSEDVTTCTTCTVPDTKENSGVCSKPVRVTEKGVECEVCTQWFHIKCENVSTTLYEVLKDQKNKCHWLCSSCEVGAKKL